MPNHDLVDFMVAAGKSMAEEYARIQKRVGEDPGTAGDQGEENWATLLRNWLPPAFQIVTKGRILGHQGIASPQIDVLVLQPEYPKHLLDKKLYLAGGVLAAFECKLTLEARHLDEWMQNSVALTECFVPETGTPYKEIQRPLVYGLLAHSHGWKRPNSKPVTNIEAKLRESDTAILTHPRQIPDLLCVSDVGNWSSFKMSYLGPEYGDTTGQYGTGSILSTYVRHSSEDERQVASFTPIGSLLASLMSKLMWRYRSLESLGQYFTQAGIRGTGQGGSRSWPADIYSPDVLQRIRAGAMANGTKYNEWAMGFE